MKALVYQGKKKKTIEDEGQAKSVLNDKNSTVTAGDMIFIPQGIPSWIRA